MGDAFGRRVCPGRPSGDDRCRPAVPIFFAGCTILWACHCLTIRPGEPSSAPARSAAKFVFVAALLAASNSFREFMAAGLEYPLCLFLVALLSFGIARRDVGFVGRGGTAVAVAVFAALNASCSHDSPDLGDRTGGGRPGMAIPACVGAPLESGGRWNRPAHCVDVLFTYSIRFDRAGPTGIPGASIAAAQPDSRARKALPAKRVDPGAAHFPTPSTGSRRGDMRFVVPKENPCAGPTFNRIARLSFLCDLARWGYGERADALSAAILAAAALACRAGISRSGTMPLPPAMASFSLIWTRSHS